MLIEAVVIVSVTIPPPEVLPPRSPYEYRWWEEADADSVSFGDDLNEEEAFRMLIEEVLKSYESGPWPRQEP